MTNDRHHLQVSDLHAYYVIAIRGIEAALGIRYPPSAPQLLANLAKLLSSQATSSGWFEQARLLTTPETVAAQFDELEDPLYQDLLLPFLVDYSRGEEFPDVYGYDLSDPEQNRIAVFSIHTFVQLWPTPEAFLKWMSNEHPKSPQLDRP
jgi:hypothetical protein